MMNLNEIYGYIGQGDFNTLKELNRKNMKSIVKYFSKLRKNEILNDKQFTYLISLACSNYVENELDLRLSKILS